MKARFFAEGLQWINGQSTMQIGGNVNGAANHIQKENIDYQCQANFKPIQDLSLK